MPDSSVIERLLTLAHVVLAGRAGLFARVTLGGVIFVAGTTALRTWTGATTRAWAQVALSVLLIGALTSPALISLMVAHALLFYWLVERGPRGPSGTVLIALLLLVQVIGPIYWLPNLTGYEGKVRELVAFATNMSQLRAWAYAYDRRRRQLPAAASLRDYALYMFFFPGFVSGPLCSPTEFFAGQLADYWEERSTRSWAGALWAERWSVVRIGFGLMAVAAVTRFVPVLSTQGYRAAEHASGLGAWAHAIGVYFGVYLGFFGWSEMAIGFGRLAGHVLPENFDYALGSYGVADFWRRWNIRLGRWMHDYIYLPLGGAHPGGRRDRVAWWNLAAVFFGVAIYHHLGALKLLGPGLLSWRMFFFPWLLWALYNTLGTLVTRTWRRPEHWSPRVVVVVAGTFLFNCMALMTAFLPPFLGWHDLGTLYRRLFLLGW